MDATARAAMLTALAALLFGVAPLSAQFDGPDAEAVRAREVAFAQTMADRDLDAFTAFLSEEAIFFAGDRALRGKEAIVAGWAPFFEGDAAPFSWTPDQVQVLQSGSLALSTGPVTGADGSSAGRFNSIWRKDPDGVWRVVFDKGS